MGGLNLLVTHYSYIRGYGGLVSGYVLHCVKVLHYFYGRGCNLDLLVLFYILLHVTIVGAGGNLALLGVFKINTCFCYFKICYIILGVTFVTVLKLCYIIFMLQNVT